MLLIMTDDQGFGAPSTFGGVIPTPAMDRIAKQGLRFTNFHSTSLCSPTRAALITGRNHHSVGFGVVGELATGYSGYDSIIPIEKGTILKENGYATSWFGKDHSTPYYQSSQAGPFNQWPNCMGFDYFYGFVGGDASQWQPNLFRNTTAIYPFEGNPGWNMETAMADEAIGYIKQLKEVAPGKPWLVYYVPGATHAPHHPTPEWIKKIGDMHLFDDDWNKLRETIFGTEFTYPGELTGVPASAAPDILNKSYTITADIEIPEGGADGMIVTQGGRFGGYGLFLSRGDFGVGRGRVVYLYNLLDLKRTMWEGPELEAGKHTVVFDYKTTGTELGTGGTGVLSVDGKQVATNSLEHGIPVTCPEDETFDIGQGTRTSVELLEYRYDTPFKFTGKIDKLTFKLGRSNQ
ncbi:hypothetical protein ATY81_04900 [Rhizobium sp. R72]|nr:hypothetical protein ATY81_04900 [Rhizobium sp. R72]OWW06341.1 hypothetical protein ATY80_04900 [Rhizobium sp. R711]